MAPLFYKYQDQWYRIPLEHFTQIGDVWYLDYYTVVAFPKHLEEHTRRMLEMGYLTYTPNSDIYCVQHQFKFYDYQLKEADDDSLC